MTLLYFITHPDVVIDRHIPVPRWRLSDVGIARMETFSQEPWLSNLGAIFCSDEQKAIDGAKILGKTRHQPFHVVRELGENDRSSTGYLPRAEFEETARQFFANPHSSIRGWERAVDAQSRIVSAVNSIMDGAQPHCDIAIVSHGGVGALYLCHLEGIEISEAASQPGDTGGNFFVVDRPSKKLLLGWRSIG